MMMMFFIVCYRNGKPVFRVQSVASKNMHILGKLSEYG